MGQCYAKSITVDDDNGGGGCGGGGGGCSGPHTQSHRPRGAAAGRSSPAEFWPSPFSPASITASSPARSSPHKYFRRPFAPLSPARHIKAALARRRPLPPSPSGGGFVPEGVSPCGIGGGEAAEARARPPLDKSFGYGKDFGARYELEKEIGRGHFGHTCSARVKKREIKEELVAVKIISKDKMATAVSIEDVRREVKILRGLSHHENMVKFYDAYEDAHNVYIVMELCEGGELLDRILSRGGCYSEEDAKGVVVQMLNAAAFCHLQGVVHRDLKPENFLFTTGDENAPLKMIDFGLSDFVEPDERLHDIVGSAYYVAPEVLHRSYSTEADIWSIGVITYILLSGSRPFWAQTESGIFRSVLRADPNFHVLPWPSMSPEAKDFLRKLLNKDYRKRMTAAQALAHPWLLEEHRRIPLDILIYKLVKSYIRASALKRAALKALSKVLTEKELIYLRAQFNLLEPNRDGVVSFGNFRRALMLNATRVMTESKVLGILRALEPLSHRPMGFEEFCAAAVSPYQLEASETWVQTSAAAFEHFEKEGNRAISVEELAWEMNLTFVAHHMVHDWIRPTDGKLNLLGYTKFLHGVTIRTSNSRSSVRS